MFSTWVFQIRINFLIIQWVEVNAINIYLLASSKELYILMLKFIVYVIYVWWGNTICYADSSWLYIAATINDFVFIWLLVFTSPLEPDCVLFGITEKSGVITSPLLLWDFSYMTVLLRCVFVFFSLMENGWAVTSVSVGNVVGRWSLFHY